MADRGHPARERASGLSRAGLVLTVAVVAAALVLAGGALRSGPGPSPAPPTPSGNPAPASSTTRPPTPEPTVASTVAPPEPTEIAGVRGEFVGPLGHVETCAILYERDGVLELVLPDAYRTRFRGEAMHIVAPDGRVVAAEGDLVGVNGTVRDGGSFCMSGPQLHVSRIVDVVRRDGQ